MKFSEIEIGGRYLAKVSGVMTTVRVLGIREIAPAWHADTGWRKRIDVVNERTGRKLTFSSAAKLRRKAEAEPKQPTAAPPAPSEVQP